MTIDRVAFKYISNNYDMGTDTFYKWGGGEGRGARSKGQNGYT